MEFLLQSNFNERKEKRTRKAPVYRIISLNVAHSACEMSHNVMETSRLQAYFCLRLSRLSEFDSSLHLVVRSWLGYKLTTLLHKTPSYFPWQACFQKATRHKLATVAEELEKED
jgi:hypothetical protein